MKSRKCVVNMFMVRTDSESLIGFIVPGRVSAQNHLKSTVTQPGTTSIKADGRKFEKIPCGGSIEG